MSQRPGLGDNTIAARGKPSSATIHDDGQVFVTIHAGRTPKPVRYPVITPSKIQGSASSTAIQDSDQQFVTIHAGRTPKLIRFPSVISPETRDSSSSATIQDNGQRFVTMHAGRTPKPVRFPSATPSEILNVTNPTSHVINEDGPRHNVDAYLRQYGNASATENMKREVRNGGTAHQALNQVSYVPSWDLSGDEPPPRASSYSSTSLQHRMSNRILDASSVHSSAAYHRPSLNLQVPQVTTPQTNVNLSTTYRHSVLSVPVRQRIPSVAVRSPLPTPLREWTEEECQSCYVAPRACGNAPHRQCQGFNRPGPPSIGEETLRRQNSGRERQKWAREFEPRSGRYQ